nr:hypothetical protein [Clostridium sporogenes]
MNNFTFTQDNCKEETTYTWLIAALQFSLKINLFKIFEGFKLKMKRVKYSVYQKLIIVMMFIACGCEITKDINEKLGMEKLLNYTRKVTFIRKNQSGYRLASAFTGEHSETIAMILDSGNTHCTNCFNELLESIVSKYKDQIHDGR